MTMTLYYLGKIGYKFFGHPRQYTSTTTGLTICHCRDIDIPNTIGTDGVRVDIGICSGAALGEFGGEIVRLIDLPYGKEQLLVYVNQLLTKVKSIEDLKGKRIKVQTSRPNTSSKYCSEQGIIPEIDKMDSPEPIIKDPNFTGKIIGIEYMSLQDLWEDHRVIDSREGPNVALIANPQSYEKHRDRIDGFAHRLKVAVDSEGWRLLKFNVPEADLEKVRECLPSMKGPTYANILDKKGWYAVESALPNGKIEEVITNLRKTTGAMGFLDQELGGVEL